MDTETARLESVETSFHCMADRVAWQRLEQPLLEQSRSTENRLAMGQRLGTLPSAVGEDARDMFAFSLRNAVRVSGRRNRSVLDEQCRYRDPFDFSRHDERSLSVPG